METKVNHQMKVWGKC